MTKIISAIAVALALLTSEANAQEKRFVVTAEFDRPNVTQTFDTYSALRNRSGKKFEGNSVRISARGPIRGDVFFAANWEFADVRNTISFSDNELTGYGGYPTQHDRDDSTLHNASVAVEYQLRRGIFVGGGYELTALKSDVTDSLRFGNIRFVDNILRSETFHGPLLTLRGQKKIRRVELDGRAGWNNWLRGRYHQEVRLDVQPKVTVKNMTTPARGWSFEGRVIVDLKKGFGLVATGRIRQVDAPDGGNVFNPVGVARYPEHLRSSGVTAGVALRF